MTPDEKVFEIVIVDAACGHAKTCRGYLHQVEHQAQLFAWGRDSGQLLIVPEAAADKAFTVREGDSTLWWRKIKETLEAFDQVK